MRVYYTADNRESFKNIQAVTYHECTDCGEVVKPYDKMFKVINTWQTSVCKFCENEDFNIFKEIESND